MSGEVTGPSVMPREVTPIPKTNNGPCACGCGEGALRVRPWVDGLHIRKCPCRRCVGGRQSPNARRRENKIAADLGGSRDAMSGAMSGVDVRAGLWVFEETANVTLVRGLRSWWQSKQTVKKLERLMARTGEARAFIASWDGKPRLVVMPYEDFKGQIRGGNL